MIVEQDCTVIKLPLTLTSRLGVYQMTTATKTAIKPTWTQEKLQEVTSNAIINNYMGISKLFEKLSPELRHEFRVTMAEMKADYYKSLNVKTPLEMATAMAEFDTNVFGSKVVVVGDENKASIEFENCACWEKMQKHACFTPAIGESLGECFGTSVKLIAEKLGMKGEVVMTETSAVVHFSK